MLQISNIKVPELLGVRIMLDVFPTEVVPSGVSEPDIEP